MTVGLAGNKPTKTLDGFDFECRLTLLHAAELCEEHPDKDGKPLDAFELVQRADSDLRFAAKVIAKASGKPEEEILEMGITTKQARTFAIELLGWSEKKSTPQSGQATGAAPSGQSEDSTAA